MVFGDILTLMFPIGFILAFFIAYFAMKYDWKIKEFF